MVVAFGVAESPEGDGRYACPAGARFVVACRRRVDFAGCKACAARRRGVPFVRTKGTKIRLGLCPKTP